MQERSRGDPSRLEAEELEGLLGAQRGVLLREGAQLALQSVLAEEERVVVQLQPADAQLQRGGMGVRLGLGVRVGARVGVRG